MDRRVVCGRCAKIKQACDGGIPCARCKRLDVVCEAKSSQDTKQVPLDKQPSKAVKITRTHTGCVTCKKRKRKCDERRPKCSDCRRLCLECMYPTAPREAQSTVISPQPTATESPVARLTATPFEDESIVSDILDVAFDDYDEPADYSDLTEMWPITSQSQMATYSSETGSTPSPNPNLPLVMLSTSPDLACDEDKSLLNHYMKVVAGVLSRCDDHRSNPYLSKVLPMALANQLVMDAVLALSANHWKKMQPTLWKRGTIHQTNALQSLAKLLPHIENDTADAALSATLLLAMIELFDGTSSHWKFHLDGARRLLSAFEKKAAWSQRTEFRTFYRQLYHYLDSATTISTCHPPLLEIPKEKSGPAGGLGAGSPRYNLDDEEALYGIPKSLFHFVDKLNGLAYQRKFRDDPVFENMFRASAESLQKDLEQWANDHKLQEPPSALPAGSTHEAAVHHATTAFEQALQLRLHQVVNGYSLDSEKVKHCVTNILDAIQEIRYGSSLESSLIFPLVMAGGSCDTEHERLIIQDRFLVMERTLGFRYIYTAHELVQGVWKEREIYQGTDQDVNWAAIRYFQIPGLALV